MYISYSGLCLCRVQLSHPSPARVRDTHTCTQTHKQSSILAPYQNHSRSYNAARRCSRTAAGSPAPDLCLVPLLVSPAPDLCLVPLRVSPVPDLCLVPLRVSGSFSQATDQFGSGGGFSHFIERKPDAEYVSEPCERDGTSWVH